jgi:hypothetical protein
MSWEEPLETNNGRKPWRYTGMITTENTETLRHIHCLYYEKCLADACEQCKSTETWACPMNCVGRATHVEFPPVVLSEEFSSRLRNG